MATPKNMNRGNKLECGKFRIARIEMFWFDFSLHNLRRINWNEMGKCAILTHNLQWLVSALATDWKHFHLCCVNCKHTLPHFRIEKKNGFDRRKLFLYNIKNFICTDWIRWNACKKVWLMILGGDNTNCLFQEANKRMPKLKTPSNGFVLHSHTHTLCMRVHIPNYRTNISINSVVPVSLAH